MVIGSLEYVYAAVTATIGGVDHDPTGDPVEMAFIGTEDDPAEDDWVEASWETISGAYFAKALVGPSNGVIDLAKGTYRIYVRVTDDPERPVLRAGVLEII